MGIDGYYMSHTALQRETATKSIVQTYSMSLMWSRPALTIAADCPRLSTCTELRDTGPCCQNYTRTSAVILSSHTWLVIWSPLLVHIINYHCFRYNAKFGICRSDD